MNTMQETRKRMTWTTVLLGVIFLVLFTYLFTQWQQNGTLLPVWGEAEQMSDELDVGSYYTLHDKDSGEELEYINRRVFEGDELLTGDNRHYKIRKVEGQKAHCEFLGERDTKAVLAELKQTNGEYAAEAVSSWPEAFQSIAIYCTHTDESYVPTSGTESENGDGDILDVAETMVEVLEEQGIDVIHSDNIHDPHDKEAYQRSRKTASQLLQEAPAAIIDVHRDGVPDPAYYATELSGEPATQIRLVVGRQNENSEANIEFAEKMKAYYDEVKPGLIKSIFMAKGNYNQDLAPHSILLEVGTHTNSLKQAQVGAREFADALPQFLGLKAAADNQPDNSADADKAAEKSNTEAEGSGFGKVLLWIILLAAAGGLGYLWISRSSMMSGGKR